MADYSVYNYIAQVLFAVVFVVGVIGNSLVCYVFGYKRKRNRTITETLLFYLGVVDLMTSLLTPLQHIYFISVSYKKWHFGSVACKLFVPLAPITTTISAGIILIIGLDRYRVIVTPFKRHFTLRQIHIGILMATVLSVFSFLHYIVWVTPIKGGTCQVATVGNLAFAIPNIIMLLIRDTTFLTLFTWINIRICLALKRRESNPTLQAMTGQDNKKHGSEIRILMTVGVLFFIFIFPADAIHLIFTISWLDDDGIELRKVVVLNLYLKVLHVANSCVNVFIYSRLHKNFRKIVKAGIPGFQKEKRSSRNSHDTTVIWNTTDGQKDSSEAPETSCALPLQIQTDDQI